MHRIYCISADPIDTFSFSMTMTGVTTVLLPNQLSPDSCLSQQFQQQQFHQQL
jgi:hypothetical protein